MAIITQSFCRTSFTECLRSFALRGFFIVMRVLFKVLFCLILVIGLQRVWAGQESSKVGVTDADTEKLVALLSKIKTIESDFTQLVHSAQGKPMQKMSGSMRVLRPHYFYWQIVEPYEQTLVVRQERLYIIDNDLEQVTVQSVQKSVGPNPALLLSGNPQKVKEHYNVVMQVLETEKTGEQHNENRYRFTLTPLFAEALFDQLTVIFAGDTLESMDFKDNLGQATAIDFKSVFQNKPLTKEKFEVSFPSNYDVIEDLQS